MSASPRMPAESLATAPPLQAQQVDELIKLQKAAQRITSILDLDQLIEQVVREVAESFGYLETNIYVHDEEHSELVLSGVHGCTIHGKGGRLKIGKDGMVGYVAATGQMRYAPDVRKDPYYIACEPSTLSEVAIPLYFEGRLVGVFTASHPELDGFPAHQLRMLQSLCCQIAAAVHNARRFQYERRERERMSTEVQEARAIQQALLPKSSPYMPGFSVSGWSVPAGAVGGDWYDFIDLEDGRWGLVLADVSGKGMAAALLMSATRGISRSLVGASCSPGEVLSKLNRMLVEDFPSGRFVTMVYAVLDPAQRTLTFANAGHLRPLLVEHDCARFLDSEKGMPLGLGFGGFSETEVRLPKNSRLVFYSDGITEAENPDEQEYGPERLQSLILRPEASAVNILEEVRTFADGASLQDDATVIFIQAN